MLSNSPQVGSGSCIWMSVNVEQCHSRTKPIVFSFGAFLLHIAGEISPLHVGGEGLSHGHFGDSRADPSLARLGNVSTSEGRNAPTLGQSPGILTLLFDKQDTQTRVRKSPTDEGLFVLSVQARNVYIRNDTESAEVETFLMKCKKISKKYKNF